MSFVNAFGRKDVCFKYIKNRKNTPIINKMQNCKNFCAL